ncbi:MAG TPA: hypothetical protein VNP04_29615 [Alphaproteobacteria bacterium]|nr:hypothetical protein [Alphaproteobacteria bacterium]
MMYRARDADPEAFGLSPDSDLKGRRFIRSRLLHDLARLNKRELLLWDAWGCMEKEPTAEDLRLSDRAAELTQAGDAAFPELRALCERQRALKVPLAVMSYSPGAAPREVAL